MSIARMMESQVKQSEEDMQMLGLSKSDNNNINDNDNNTNNCYHWLPVISLLILKISLGTLSSLSEAIVNNGSHIWLWVTCQPTVGNLSANCRPTGYRHITNCRPTPLSRPQIDSK